MSSLHSPSFSTSSPISFIAVHAGAGYHNPSHHRDLQQLFQTACLAALNDASTVEEAVMVAIQHLEASPLTNAGRGSCLTEDGHVECESSIMLGNGAFSGVGAVSGVEHPIHIAYQLIKERNELGMIKELGRVRPILLVGEGAWRYAEEHGFARVEKAEWGNHHVTPETRKKWEKYRDIIAKHKEEMAAKKEEVEAGIRSDGADHSGDSSKGTSAKRRREDGDEEGDGDRAEDEEGGESPLKVAGAERHRRRCAEAEATAGRPARRRPQGRPLAVPRSAE